MLTLEVDHRKRSFWSLRTALSWRTLATIVILVSIVGAGGPLTQPGFGTLLVELAGGEPLVVGRDLLPRRLRERVGGGGQHSRTHGSNLRLCRCRAAPLACAMGNGRRATAHSLVPT